MSAKEPDFILMQISLSSKTNSRGGGLQPLRWAHLLLSISCTSRFQLLLNRTRVFVLGPRVYDFMVLGEVKYSF